MKKIMLSLSFLMIFTVFTVSNTYANKCMDQADVCYSRCDKNWKGDTIFDGAGRTACKSGCAIVEAGCVVASWF